jgi:Uma2 family endonuclease
MNQMSFAAQARGRRWTQGRLARYIWAREASMAVIAKDPQTDDAPAPRRPYRFTFADQLKLREAGVFKEGEHIELVDGEFVLMPSEGGAHMRAIQVLNAWLVGVLLSQPGLLDVLAVYPHGTLLFDDGNRREPDLMVARARLARAVPSPAEVSLLIEVAASSAPADLGEKRRQYAAAGIEDYWVWETGPKRLTVFRAPEGGDYASQAILQLGETIAPLFAPAAAFAIATLDA